MKFSCTECDMKYRKWVGLCYNCNNWNSVIEFVDIKSQKQPSSLAIKPSEVHINEINHYSFNFDILDGFFNDSLATNAACLISGSPGSGKTTFLIDLLKRSSRVSEKVVLYISTEESVEQLYLRFFSDRDYENILISNADDISEVLNILKIKHPKLVIIDSVQMLIDKENGVYSYGVNSFKAIVSQLIVFCKKNDILAFFVSQIVKDGSFAGPKYLEHMVDIVLKLEKFNKDSKAVQLKCMKNRFGSVDNNLYFNINKNGIKFDQNIFINYKKGRANKPGNTTGLIFYDNRVIFVQVEALVVKSKNNTAKRVAHNYSKKRLDVLLAVLEKTFSISLSDYDIFISSDYDLPDASQIDLAVLSAVYSSFKVKNFKSNFFSGVVSLSGAVFPQSVILKDFDILEENSTLCFYSHLDCQQVSKSFVYEEITNVIEINYLFK